MLLVLISAALCALLAGVSSEEMEFTQPTVELLVPGQVRVGDTVKIKLSLRNDGDQVLDLELPGRPVAFDILIRGPDGAEVWRRLRNFMTGSALMLLTLRPGQNQEFTAEWPQVDNLGRPVAAGQYTVLGVLPIQGRTLKTAVHELVITR